MTDRQHPAPRQPKGKGRFGAGAGLYLLVRSRKAKFWLFRYKHGSNRHEMDLGPAVGRAAVRLAVVRARA
jgi:hypothetical protein